MREINEFIQHFIELTEDEIILRQRNLDSLSLSDKKHIIYDRYLVNELLKLKNVLQIHKLHLKRVNEDRTIE